MHFSVIQAIALCTRKQKKVSYIQMSCYTKKIKHTDTFKNFKLMLNHSSKKVVIFSNEMTQGSHLGKVAGCPDPLPHRLSVRMDPGNVPPHLLPRLLINGQTAPINNAGNPTIPRIFPLVLLFLISLLTSSQTLSSPDHSEASRGGAGTRLDHTGPES